MNGYPYNEIGFEGVVLFGGVREVDTMFGRAVEIDRIAELHHAIFKALCTCDVDLTAGMIHAMRTELELSQADLGKVLGLTDRQMVSLYERGRRKMPKAHQEVLKRRLLARIDGAKISVKSFDSQLGERAPERFEFTFEQGAWIWSNSPHQPAISSSPWKPFVSGDQEVIELESLEAMKVMALGLGIGGDRSGVGGRRTVQWTGVLKPGLPSRQGSDQDAESENLLRMCQ